MQGFHIYIFKSFCLFYKSVWTECSVFFGLSSKDWSGDGWFLEITQLIKPSSHSEVISPKSPFSQTSSSSVTRAPVSPRNHNNTTQTICLASSAKVRRVVVSSSCVFSPFVWFVARSRLLVLWLVTWPSGPAVKSGPQVPALILPPQLPSVCAGEVRSFPRCDLENSYLKRWSLIL